MEFRILGSVDVRSDGVSVAIGGPKLRTLLAVLLLDANHVVSRGRLIDAVWGERPPPSASHTLDDYVWRLRRAIGADRIERCAPGYRLCVRPGELDFDCFEERLGSGREALAGGRPRIALEDLDVALALWRGPALADVELERSDWCAAVARLEDRRLLACEERMEAALALGRSAELIVGLETLVAHNPFRERLRGQLMLALYRAGRHADALAVYQDMRLRLADDLGLEPGPSLRALQRRILEHDQSLRGPCSQQPGRRANPPRAGRRPAILAALLAAGALAAAAVAWTLLAPGRMPALPRTASGLVELSVPSGSPVAAVEVAVAPAAIAATSRAVWLADPDSGSLSRIDPRSGTVAGRIGLGGNPGVVAFGGGSLWVAGVPGDDLTRIDPATETVTQTIGLAGGSAAALAYGAGGLWVADKTDSSLISVDPVTGAVRRTISLDVQPTAIAIGAGSLWVAGYDAHVVAQVDPRTGRTVATIPVGKGPVAIAVADGAVWVASALDSTVSRIAPANAAVTATIPVGSGPVGLAAAGGDIWVASQYSRTVSRIDPGRNAVVRATRVGGMPTSVAAVGRRLWVGTQPRPEHHGGTLVLVRRAPLPLDPGVSVGVSPFQTTNLAYDGLVTFNHVAGPRGLELVPDLALALPQATDGGRTYTFRLRPRIRYSDGRLVRAADFRRAMERALLIRAVDTDALANILGARACVVPRASRCDLRRGIVADEPARTVTFHLYGPDAQFLANVANGGLSVPVPSGTPMHDARLAPIPGTGPYAVADADRSHIRYVRNRLFREWSHAAQPSGDPDEIVWRFGLTPAEQVRAVERGRADWMADAVPGAQLPTLRARFAIRVHSYPNLDTEFLQFNTRHAPFDDVRVRRALNLAIDRQEIVRIWGGGDVATPTCQLLPPGVPGFRRYCPYTRDRSPENSWSAPDLARARHLVSASGTRNTRITVWGWNDDAFAPPRVTRHVAAVLRDLGYRTRVKSVSHASLAHPPSRVFGAISVIPGGWAGIAPDEFFTPWISCAGANVHGHFCVPRIDASLRRARTLQATRPRAAARRWAAIDREIVDRAALVPLVNPRQVEFVSARLRNLQHHAYLGPIVAEARVR